MLLLPMYLFAYLPHASHTDIVISDLHSANQHTLVKPKNSKNKKLTGSKCASTGHRPRGNFWRLDTHRSGTNQGRAFASRLVSATCTAFRRASQRTCPLGSCPDSATACPKFWGNSVHVCLCRPVRQRTTILFAYILFMHPLHVGMWGRTEQGPGGKQGFSEHTLSS